MIFWKNYKWTKLLKMEEEHHIERKSKRKNEDGKEEVERVSDLVFSLDTETTSYFITPELKVMMFDETKSPDFYKDCLKQSLMYIWMIGIEDEVIYGRTYQDLLNCFHNIARFTMGDKFIVYIHNMGFDFQFLRNIFNVGKIEIFAREERKPMKAFIPELNMEIRCSYMLTNRSLENVAKDMKLEHQKQVGSLDYNIFRTPLTELSDEELSYCEFDILVMQEFLKIYKERFKSIEMIPLTQTGIIRRQITRLFFKNKKHHDLISAISPQNLEEYNQLDRVYMGGYTHANKLNSNRILKNVYSYDIKSSYPYICCVEKFPMTKFSRTNLQINQIDWNKYCGIIDIEFKNIRSNNSNTYLSKSKAKVQLDETTFKFIENPVYDNGRLISADYCRYELTDIDLQIVLNNYDFDECVVHSVDIAKKEYLPKELIKYILKLFKDKTQFQGVPGMESRYKEAKEQINCIYGLLVTKTLTDEISFEGNEWKKTEMTDARKNEKLSEMIEKKGQNLNFAWGVWVSAYARKHLWDVMAQIGDDVVYSDTDSIKFLNFEKNDKFFKEDDKIVDWKINQVCSYFLDEDILPSSFSPVAPNGEPARLGHFDREKDYKTFKTIGAKKYAFTYENNFRYTIIVKEINDEIEEKLKDFKNSDIKDNKVVFYNVNNEKIEKINEIFKNDIQETKKTNQVNITVSGVNKKTGEKALESLGDFKIGKKFNYNESGKLIHFYNDDMVPIKFSDGYETHEKYGICLMKTTYEIGISEDYNDLLKTIHQEDFLNNENIQIDWTK